MTSPFGNLDLPPWDDDDDEQNGSLVGMDDPQEPSPKPTVTRDDSEVFNKQPNQLVCPFGFPLSILQYHFV